MSDNSKIEWTDATWSPVVGCKAVSPGCDHCYAAREASGRLRHLPAYAGLAEDGVFTGEVRCLPDRLELPLRWRKPRRIFVNSMSDLFHPKVPDQFILSVFDVMRQAHWHTFQVLTKRPRRMAGWTRRYFGSYAIPNVWLGTSIEMDDYAFRAGYLQETPAAVRFLSLEPLLGSLPSLGLDGIGWVIVGGESGPGARPMLTQWARDIRDRCVEAGVPFLFKQHGEWMPLITAPTSGQLRHYGAWFRIVPTPSTPEARWMERVGKKAAGRELDGRTWDEYPR